MRYYVLAIQYNVEKEAENRTAPKAFDKREDAIKEYHAQMAKDMGNATLGWSLCMVINSEMGIEAKEKWVREVELVIEPEVVEE